LRALGKLWSSHPVLTSAGAILFVWGALCSYVALHFTVRALLETESPGHSELAIGVVLALLYGWPAWLGLPVASAVAWVRSRWLSLALALPVLVAGICWSVL
jgi:hypothetical protein